MGSNKAHVCPMGIAPDTFLVDLNSSIESVGGI